MNNIKMQSESLRSVKLLFIADYFLVFFMSLNKSLLSLQSQKCSAKLERRREWS